MSKVLVLRTCSSNGSSHGGFIWPLTEGSVVTAPDWNPAPECGAGLHGLLWGEGAGSLLSWEENAVWMIVSVDESDIVSLGEKVKFPTCTIEHVGNQKSATDYMYENSKNKAIVGVCIAGGNRSTVTGGYGSTVTGGYKSTVTGGYKSTVTGGRWSTVTGGRWSTVSGGRWSTVSGGDCSTVTGGYGSTVTGGEDSILSLKFWDGKRCREIIAYVGEDGVEKDVKYKLDDNRKFVKAE